MNTIGQLMSDGVRTVHHQVPMRVCLKTMREHGIRHMPVLDDNGRVLGLVTDLDVARACREGQDLGWVIEVVKAERLHVAPDDQPVNVLAKMLDRHHDCAVVVDAIGDPIGLFTERDALALAGLVVKPWMPVGDLMTRDDLFTVEAGTPANKVLEGMFDREVRHAMITEDGALFGVVSVRDLVGRKLAVGKLTKDPVYAVTEDSGVGEAIAQMHERGIGCLPVVRPEDNVPLGILTRTDVLRALARQLIASSVPSATR